MQLPEFVKADSELSQNVVEKGRPNLTSAVNRDRDRTPILMDPPLMASSLSAPFKAKSQGGVTKLLSAALGINDRSAVRRQFEPHLTVFGGNHFEHAFEFD